VFLHGLSAGFSHFFTVGEAITMNRRNVILSFALLRADRFEAITGRMLAAAGAPAWFLPMSAQSLCSILGVFRADRGGIEQHVGAHQRHGRVRLRKPLVPHRSRTPSFLISISKTLNPVAGEDKTSRVARTLRICDLRYCRSPTPSASRRRHNVKCIVGASKL